MIRRKRCPAHPGKILMNLYLTPLDLKITKLAEILGVSRKAISSIINGHKSVTPEMALKLSKALPNSTPESWLNLQNNYDLWQAKRKSKSWSIINPVPQYIQENREVYDINPQ